VSSLHYAHLCKAFLTPRSCCSDKVIVPRQCLRKCTLLNMYGEDRCTWGRSLAYLSWKSTDSCILRNAMVRTKEQQYSILDRGVEGLLHAAQPGRERRTPEIRQFLRIALHRERENGTRSYTKRTLRGLYLISFSSSTGPKPRLSDVFFIKHWRQARAEQSVWFLLSGRGVPDSPIFELPK
jgi:hypothetical protein